MPNDNRQYGQVTPASLDTFVRARQEVEDHLTSDSPLGTEIEFVATIILEPNIQAMLIEHYLQRGWRLMFSQTSSVSTFILVRIAIM